MTEELITITKVAVGYNVEYYNGAYMGKFEQDIDGYYYYWPTSKAGCWTAHAMRAIADKLDELNKPWDDRIMNDPIFNKGTEDG